MKSKIYTIFFSLFLLQQAAAGLCGTTEAPITSLRSGWQYAWEAPGVNSNTYEKITASSPEWRSTDSPCLATEGDPAYALLRTKLPDLPYSEPTLYLHQSHQIQALESPYQIYLNGERLVEISAEDTKKSHGTLSFEQHFVDLPEQFQSKELLIRTSVTIARAGACTSISLGSRSDHIENIIRSNIAGIFTGILCIILAIIGAVTAVTIKKSVPFISFCLLMFSAGFWVFDQEDSQLKLLVTDWPLFWYTCSITAGFSIVIFLISYWNQLFPNSLNPITRILWNVHKITTIGLPFLFLLDFITPYQMSWHYPKMLSTTIFFFGIDIVRYLKKHKDLEVWAIAIGSLALIIAGINDVLTYHRDPPWKHDLVHWGILILVICYTSVLIRRVQKILDLKGEERVQHAKAVAIAETTQMLAHDVRKPFSTLKVGLDLIKTEQDPERIMSVTKIFTEEVDKALFSVEGMLADILEVESDRAPDLVPTAPETLVESTVNDIFRLQRKKDVTFSYQLEHRKNALVDTIRVQRVFSNIVTNASQAVPSGGRIWFITKDHSEKNGKTFILFAIGNSGSYIPEHDWENIFTSFFSQGKKTGTGLGLAIAKKIVDAHGGKIWCTSSREEGTIFYFTLPAASTTVSRNIHPRLPLHSNEVMDLRQSIFESKDRVKDLAQLHKDDKKELHILLVDDEALYINALERLLLQFNELPVVPFIVSVHSYEEALKKIAHEEFDLIICDVELGDSSKNGYDLVAHYRSRGGKAYVCMHSNRYHPEDLTTASKAGANISTRKPMNMSDFREILMQMER